MPKKIGKDVVGGKIERVSPLESYGFRIKGQRPEKSATMCLSEILQKTRKYISEAESDMEIMNALINMDTEVKAFRDSYYPSMDQMQRLESEELIRDMVGNLEKYARGRMRFVRKEGLTW